MNHQAHAMAQPAEPYLENPTSPPPLRLVHRDLQPTAAVLVVSAASLQSEAPPKPSGWFRAFWQRFFGPPEVDVRGARSDFGALRAMYEIGSDYLPSSGTWPTR